MAATSANNTSQQSPSQPSEQSERESAKTPSQLEQLSEPIDQDPNIIAMQDAAEQQLGAQTEQLQERSEVQNGHLPSAN